MSSGVFTTGTIGKPFAVTPLWRLYVAITLPLTIIIITCWKLYNRNKANYGPHLVGAKNEAGPSKLRKRLFVLRGLIFSSSQQKNVETSAA